MNVFSLAPVSKESCSRVLGFPPPPAPPLCPLDKLAGLGYTFLGSLASFLTACAGFFPSEAGVRDDGAGVRLELPRSHTGGVSKSCAVLEEPCHKAR